MISFFRRLLVIFLLANILCGCDLIYGILQREGAQEKKILGDVTPSIYNENVEYVQKLLSVHGINVGKIDGKLGGRMREAIAKFQADQGLDVTRFIDDKTWNALNVFTATGLVQDGEVQLAVVQEILKSAGLYQGRVDGMAGPRTVKALKSFQQSQGLAPDGRIGPKTLAKLNEFLLSH
jgi:peptidoglycan hydrolase-like protein with peptidoglycan-binding domain